MGEANHSTNGTVHPTVHYERDDVSFRAVLLFAFWLLVAAVVIHVGLWWLFDYYAAPPREEGMPTTLLTERAAVRVPPDPRLQVSPVQDMRELHAAEDARLQNYGWVDQQNGIVHVPIERAMQVIATQGLPPEGRSEE